MKLGAVIFSGCPEELDRLQVRTLGRGPKNLMPSVTKILLNLALQELWLVVLHPVNKTDL
jgi:hypothetical protein